MTLDYEMNSCSYKNRSAKSLFFLYFHVLPHLNRINGTANDQSSSEHPRVGRLCISKARQYLMLIPQRERDMNANFKNDG